MRCNALANIAFLSLWSNDFAQADAALADIGDAFKGSPMWFPVVESRSLRALCGGDLEASENHIRAGEVEIRVQGLPAHSWQCIELALARARLDAARGQCAAALNVLDQKIGSVERRGDPYLQAEWALESAWLALRCGDSSRARRGVDDLVGLTKPTDAGRRGDIHWLLGHVSMIDGDKIGGAIEFKRAQRIWAELGGHHPLRTIPDEYLEGPEGNIRVNGSEGAIATLLGMGGRPRLLGIQGAELIGVGEDALRVRVLAGPAGSRRTIYDSHVADTDPPRSPSHIVQLGEQDGVPYQLQVHAADLPGCRTRVVSLVGLIEAAVGMARLRREDQQRTSLWPAEEGLMLEGNVFVAPRMRELQATARRVGPSDLPVLITGETGSGKEVLGREVHDSSPRAAKGFAALVCSGVPREMLDSHLFGHRRGAFTGAVENFLGVIRANEGGTLLLDEIGEVSLDLQVKLLRFLETGEVHPLGETKPVKVDVRIVAATNQPLETLMKEGRFRQDLFYRLNVVRLTIPPLRERREEILPFFERFLMRECARMGRPVPDVSDEAIEHLLLYTWPGNVRQLLNEVKRILATLPPNAEITPAVLAGDITAERQAAIEKAVAASPTQMLVRTDQSLQAAIDQVERAMLKQALDTSPDLETAASKLDITRKGLFLKRQRLGLA